MMRERTFDARLLMLATCSHLVECLGGPEDGELRPANENGLRPNGLYVVANDERNEVVARVWVPREP